VSGEPHIRKVRPDELEEVWRVHVASSNDLLVRRGRPAARPADAPVASDARAGLASDPDGYFCAVEEGRIRGMVSALVRGRVWYLSMFFVLPATKGGAWGGRCSSGRWPTARRAGRRFAAPGRRSTRARRPAT
jgi:hypothetical protein